MFSTVAHETLRAADAAAPPMDPEERRTPPPLDRCDESSRLNRHPCRRNGICQLFGAACHGRRGAEIGEPFTSAVEEKRLDFTDRGHGKLAPSHGWLVSKQSRLTTGSSRPGLWGKCARWASK